MAQLVALEGSQKQPSRVLGLGVVNPILHMLRSKPQWGSSLGAALDALNRILGDAAAWLPPQIVLHLTAIETSQVRISVAIGNVAQVINGTFTLSNRVSNQIPMYQKDGVFHSNIWLAWQRVGASCQWFVTDTKGLDSSSGYCHSIGGQLHSLEPWNVKRWSVANKQIWGEQEAVQVEKVHATGKEQPQQHLI